MGWGGGTERARERERERDCYVCVRLRTCANSVRVRVRTDGMPAGGAGLCSGAALSFIILPLGVRRGAVGRRSGASVMTGTLVMAGVGRRSVASGGRRRRARRSQQRQPPAGVGWSRCDGGGRSGLPRGAMRVR